MKPYIQQMTSEKYDMKVFNAVIHLSEQWWTSSHTSVEVGVGFCEYTDQTEPWPENALAVLAENGISSQGL